MMKYLINIIVFPDPFDEKEDLRENTVILHGALYWPW
jgi:hypothetical protein